MTGGNETGNRRSLKVVQNDRDYDRGFVGVSMGKLAQKEQYYHYCHRRSIVLDSLLEVVNVNAKEKWPKDATLRDTTG